MEVLTTNCSGGFCQPQLWLWVPETISRELGPSKGSAKPQLQDPAAQLWPVRLHWCDSMKCWWLMCPWQNRTHCPTHTLHPQQKGTHTHTAVALLCPQQKGGHTHTPLWPWSCAVAQALAPRRFHLCTVSLTANSEQQQNKLPPPSKTPSRAFLRGINGSAEGNNRTSPGATGPHCQ